MRRKGSFNGSNRCYAVRLRRANFLFQLNTFLLVFFLFHFQFPKLSTISHPPPTSASVPSLRRPVHFVFLLRLAPLSPLLCLLPRARLYLPLEPLCFPAGPDTPGSDGSACQRTSVINSDVMDRCGAAVETSRSRSALPCQTAGGPEGGHFVPSCRPLTEGPTTNEAR